MAGTLVRGAPTAHECAMICTCLIGRKSHRNVRENGTCSSTEKFLKKIAAVLLAHQRSRQKWIRNLALNHVAEPHHA